MLADLVLPGERGLRLICRLSVVVAGVVRRLQTANSMVHSRLLDGVDLLQHVSVKRLLPSLARSTLVDQPA
ncbi:MAG TPA: hypothetical protein VF898_02485 [Chloroflexota bacterium]